jgi:hypothetical protein
MEFADQNLDIGQDILLLLALLCVRLLRLGLLVHKPEHDDYSKQTDAQNSLIRSTEAKTRT